MPAPTEIQSVSEWNTTLRAAKARTPPTPIVVDFHAQWCGPCKQIAPFYSQLASQHPHVQFLRVDVDAPGVKAIAAKYQVSAMPTFMAIQEGNVVDSLRGADPRGLASMVEKLKVAATTLPAEAEKAKAEGNKAFSAKDYKIAITHYTTAIDKAPRSAVLHANRAYSYLKLSEDGASRAATPGSEYSAVRLRQKALQDAMLVTDLDERWGKGWYRLAEVLNAVRQDASGEDVAPEKREEGARVSRDGVIEALENAVGLSDGKVKSEAEALLRSVRAEVAL
ncbi:thioredoxin-like protein [Peniophora sp. CONT]|nr:thioredoxin-like protein [Peniophora sp. CONT]